MSVQFQKYIVNTNENDEMNFYENIEIFNIKTDEINNITTNEYLCPQELKTNVFKNNDNKNINISSSDLTAPNILDKKKDCYSITICLLSKYRLVWIILLICTIAILLNIITILALNTGNKELKSKYFKINNFFYKIINALSECTNGWINSNKNVNRCYQVFRTFGRKASEAKLACFLMNAYLAEMEDKDELDFVSSNLLAENGKSTYFAVWASLENTKKY
jgi:hypothetical protein